MSEKNLINKSRIGDGYFVAPVAGIADVAGIAPVADVALQHEATGVADTLLQNKRLGSLKTAEQQEQQDFQDNKNNDMLSALPEELRMTTRMMLLSDAERNVEQARSRCEEYGVDYEAARKWAKGL